MSRARTTRRVLVIDRDATSASARGAELLRERENDVTVVTTVGDARDVLTAQDPFDLILCGLDVGAVGFYELVARIDPGATERIVFVAGSNVLLRCVPVGVGGDVSALISMVRHRSTMDTRRDGASDKSRGVSAPSDMDVSLL